MELCPKCERENNGELTAEKVAEIVAEIPIEVALKADTAVYEHRLLVCKTCDALREAVLCAHCGCFVLFRARPRKSYCPHPHGDKWLVDKGVYYESKINTSQ